MALRFLALYLAVAVISYWFGALTVGAFLPQELALAGVFLRLQHMIASRSGIDLSVEEKGARHAAPLQPASA